MTTAMAKGLYVLSLLSCLSTALAARVPRQAVSMQYTNSTVTTKPPTDPSTSGDFCCQVYAPVAGLMWWYTNATVSAVQQTVVTEYLKYNNTVVPTATVTMTNSSVARLTGDYNQNLRRGPSLSGLPTDLNFPQSNPLVALNQYDHSILLTGTEVDLGYTTIAAPTPFMNLGYIFVFPGTVDGAGTCMGSSKVPPTESVSTTGYDISSAAGNWFLGAAAEPIGYLSDWLDFTSFILSTPYVSVVSTEPGEWYTTVRATPLDASFITYLAQDSVALSRFPRIKSCSAVSGAGAPGVHVQVSFLTTSSAVTSTTNALFINKATTTSAVPASNIPPVGPISTTPPTAQPTEATQTPSNQPSDQTSAQPSGQTSVQPEPSPSTAPQKVSEEPASPSQGQIESPTVAETSQDRSVQQPTFTDNSPQPTTQKTSVDSPAAPTQSSDEPVSNGGQPSAEPAHTSSEDQASSLPEPKTVDSQGASQETSKVETVQNTATKVVVTGTSPGETSQSPPAVVIGDITASPASSGGYIVGTQALVPGSSAIEVSGTTYSLQASGGTAVINGQGVQVSTLASALETAAPIVLGGSTARPVSSDAYVVAGQTLSRGGSAVEIAGTTYSLAPSGDRVVINGEATPISALQVAPQPATVAIGDVTAAPVSSGAYYVVAGQTLSPEASAIEVSGVTYSLPKSGANIVVNGATSYANAVSTLPPVILGSVTAASFIGGGYIVSSQILSPGGIVQISGTTYSLAASGNTVFIDGKPTAIQTAASLTGATSLANGVTTPPPVVFGSVTATPLAAGGYILATQILSPGGSAVEVSGTTYSLAATGNTVFIDGKPTTVQTVTAAAPLTVGSQILTAIAASATPLVVESQTLVPGGSAITLSGTTYSLPASGTGNIVVNGQTTNLVQASDIAVLSANSQQLSFTPLKSGIVVASQTLYPGGSITVNGETLSLASSGGVVVKSGDSTTTVGLGDYIWQGIDASTSASGTETVSSSSRTSGSVTTGGLRSTTAISSASRASASDAAATTSASLASHVEVGVVGWMSILMCLVLALFAL